VARWRRRPELRDGFAVRITLSDMHSPRMWIEDDPTNGDHRACMLALYPALDSRPAANGASSAPASATAAGQRLTAVSPRRAAVVAPGSSPVEIILLLDRSGSMKGQAFAFLQKAASLALKLLPPTATFNVVDFGSVAVELFPRSVPATDAYVAHALAHIAQGMVPAKQNLGNGADPRR